MTRIGRKELVGLDWMPPVTVPMLVTPSRLIEVAQQPLNRIADERRAGQVELLCASSICRKGGSSIVI